ncbi:L,D-transpeptidase [Candidatus Saccharibacteria bacterium]|nr:L,D-transpeptidase [Candidatus Saccharibacteria bacterium]
MDKKVWLITVAAVVVIVALTIVGSSTAVAAEYGSADTWTCVYIDLSEQWLMVEQGGDVVFEAPVVTGTAGTSRATPTGTYSIYSKETCQVLRGTDYASYVDYWMPFNGGIGIHDATWLSDDEFAYGGETYLWNGSHGCINMRYDDAATVYSLVSVGDSVFVTE